MSAYGLWLKERDCDCIDLWLKEGESECIRPVIERERL